MNNKIILTILILLLMMPFSINIPTILGQTSPVLGYNHFHSLDSKEVSGAIGKMSVNSKKDMYALVTSDTEIIGKTSDLSEIIRLPSSGFKVIEWDSKGECIADGRTIRCPPEYTAKVGLIGNVFSWSPIEEKVFSIYGKQMTLWNSTDFTIIRIFDNISYTSINWNNEGSYYAAASSPSIDIYNAHNYSLVKRIIVEKNKDTSINSKILWSPDSKLIAYSSGESFIQIIDPYNGAIVKKLYHFSSSVTGFDWTPNSKYLIACSADGIINLFDIDIDDKYYEFDSKDDPIGINYINETTFLIGKSSGIIEKYIFIEKGLIAEAGPEIRDLVSKEIYLDGSKSIGEIDSNGYSWTIYLSGSNSVSLIGKTVNYMFSDPGDYRIELIVKDIYNNISKDETIAHMFSPSEKPVVNITDPPSESEVSGIVIISGTALDDIGVRGVEIKIDYGNWVKTNGLEFWNFTINTELYRNKAYDVYVRAYDDTQYSEIIWGKIYFINNIIKPNDDLPTIEIRSPLNGQEVKGIITVNGVASDDNYITIVSVIYPNIGYDAIGTINWYSKWDSRDVPDGYYLLTAIAKDNADQKTSVVVNIYVNNTGMKKNEKPSIRLLFPINNAKINNSIIINGTANDDKQLRIVQVRVNNSIWFSCNGLGTWSYQLDTKAYTNGNYTIDARAFDGELFSTYSSIIVHISNPVNNSNITKPTDSVPTFVENGCWISIFLVLFIVFCFYFWYRFQKYKFFWVSLILMLLLLTAITVPTTTHNNKNNTNIPNHSGTGNNSTNNTPSFAPDITFLSLRNDKIISNEKLLGKVVIVYFIYAPKGDFRILTDIDLLYSDYINKGNNNFSIIAFNCYLNITNEFFNNSLKNSHGTVGWDYSIDRSGIQKTFPVITYDNSWVLIDKKGFLRKYGTAQENPSTEIEKLLNEPTK